MSSVLRKPNTRDTVYDAMQTRSVVDMAKKKRIPQEIARTALKELEALKIKEELERDEQRYMRTSQYLRRKALKILTADSDTICPSCGEFRKLDQKFGWCQDCIIEHIPNVNLCHTCGGVVTSLTWTCFKCKNEALLIRFADEIEDWKHRVIQLPDQSGLLNHRPSHRVEFVVNPSKGESKETYSVALTSNAMK